MPERSADEIRSIDNQLLEMIQQVASEHELTNADVLLRLLSLTSLWVLSQAPPETSANEQYACLQQAMGNVFHHYARQILAGGRIH
jgi:hypothetical protein